MVCEVRLRLRFSLLFAVVENTNIKCEHYHLLL